MGATNVQSLASLRVSKQLVPAHSLIPNTSIQNRPLLIYHSVFSESVTASSIEAHLSSVGVVVPQWRFTMYSTSHFHSTTHEVLGISHGKAKLCFGGEENPNRFEPVVSKGDVIVVPAGVSHRLLQDLEGGFQMIGSYPPGKEWDMCYGREGEEDKIAGIKGLEWFKKDPIYGEHGPAVEG